VGILGEIHPKILNAWKLENPVAAFELNMDKIVKIGKPNNKSRVEQAVRVREVRLPKRLPFS
jgi:phenylalanyl-tRNA synthetase beta subunit